MNMNAYEIRLEILKMAKDMVCEEIFQHNDYNRTLWEDDKKSIELKRPMIASPKDVINKAKELYVFVEGISREDDLK